MTYQGGRATHTTLSRATCLELLRRTYLARVVISVRCLPAALPARIATVTDDRLWLICAEESVIVAAYRAEVLSVQIDGLDSDRTTWSVTASGLARLTPDDSPVASQLHEHLSRGARLIELPLSILAGERVG